ncbi:MAG: hypothetical protein JWO88_1258 [Frankiales bacterium]|nr:hypothetical protein [Frankiales bacterium]
MTALSRQIRVTFLLAFSGVLFMLGTVIAAIAGPIAASTYAALVLALLILAAVAARRRAARLASGRTCTCCTGTVHDPVQVI